MVSRLDKDGCCFCISEKDRRITAPEKNPGGKKPSGPKPWVVRGRSAVASSGGGKPHPGEMAAVHGWSCSLVTAGPDPLTRASCTPAWQSLMSWGMVTDDKPECVLCASKSLPCRPPVCLPAGVETCPASSQLPHLTQCTNIYETSTVDQDGFRSLSPSTEILSMKNVHLFGTWPNIAFGVCMCLF